MSGEAKAPKEKTSIKSKIKWAYIVYGIYSAVLIILQCLTLYFYIQYNKDKNTATNTYNDYNYLFITALLIATSLFYRILICKYSRYERSHFTRFTNFLVADMLILATALCIFLSSTTKSVFESANVGTAHGCRILGIATVIGSFISFLVSLIILFITRGARKIHGKDGKKEQKPTQDK